VREIHRRTRRRFSAEERVRIVLEGLRDEEGVAELCRREGQEARGAKGEDLIVRSIFTTNARHGSTTRAPAAPSNLRVPRDSLSGLPSRRLPHFG
jgi:hypothetical protein